MDNTIEKYVSTTKQSGRSNVDNLGGGFLAQYGYVFPKAGAFGLANDFWLTPKYIYSFRNGTQVVNTNVIWRPEPQVYLDSLGPAGTIFRNFSTIKTLGIAPKFYIQAYGLFGDVLDSGSTPKVVQTGNFARLGPEEGVQIVGANSFTEKFSLTGSRRDLFGLAGHMNYMSLWQITFSYSIPNIENLSLNLSYTDGRNEDTYEKQNLITLGAGLKF